jgi:hypothetical protein
MSSAGAPLTYQLSDELSAVFADGLASDSHPDVSKKRLAGWSFSSGCPYGARGWLGCVPRTALRLSWANDLRPSGTRPIVRTSFVLGWDRCRGLRFGVCGIPGPQKRGTGGTRRLSTVHRPLSTEKRSNVFGARLGSLPGLRVRGLWYPRSPKAWDRGHPAWPLNSPMSQKRDRGHPAFPGPQVRGTWGTRQ